MTATAAQPDLHERLRSVRTALDVRRKDRPSDYYIAGRQDIPEERRLHLRFHTSTHIVRLLAPGNGAGKTTAAGVEVDWWIQHDHPYQDTPREEVIVVWVCLKFQQMDIVRQRLEETCLSAGHKWNDQKHVYTWPGKGRMYVISSDGDWSTIQGVEPHLVVIDEECDPRLWRELQMRRRGARKTRFVVAATATQGLRWMYKDIYLPWLKWHEEQGMTEDQALIAQKHEWIFCWPVGGLEDNPVMGAEDRKWYLEQVQYGSEAEKAVRTRGGFMEFNSTPIFDQANLNVLQQLASKGVDGILLPADGPTAAIPDPDQVLMFPELLAQLTRDGRRRFKFQPTSLGYRGGRITIYENPRPDSFYSLGGDCAFGLGTGDFDAGVVLRRTEITDHRGNTRVECVQAAEIEGHWGDVGFCYVMAALGWYFNEALIVIERNMNGLTQARRLYDEFGYTYQYFQEDPKHRAPRRSDVLGHAPTEYDVTIQLLQEFISPVSPAGQKLPPKFVLRSAAMMKQLQEYQWRPKSSRKEMSAARDKDLTMGAPDGKHDDLCRATGLALLGWVSLPRFAKKTPTYDKGSLGDVLGHAKVLNPTPTTQSAFSSARKRR